VRIFERTPPGQQEVGPVLQEGVDRESEARAIVERARGARRQTPRWLWITALTVAAICLGAFAIGMLFAGTGDATPHAPPREIPTSRFAIGLMIGVGLGIPIGIAIASRRRDRE
jgi:hypothetical protein